MKSALRTYGMPLIAGVVFVVLTVLSISVYWYQSRTVIDEVVVRDLSVLQKIFVDINNTCHISGFDETINRVDFLNVGSFSGSELGAMNLYAPQNWHGPYLDDNPTVQGIYYQIVKTKHGYFLTPGNGVRLTNGLVVGTDIVLNADSDVNELIKIGKLHSHDGKPLAIAISIE